LSDVIQLQVRDGIPVVSSRELAERFSKRHDHLIRDIEKIQADLGSPQKWGHLFIESEWINQQNKQAYKEYLLTRDGFSLLVMGFTGKEALEWKLKYIDAFNRMESALTNQNMKVLPSNYKEALVQLLEQVEENEQLIAENQKLLPKATYHDEVLNKEDLIPISIIAKDAGFRSAQQLNALMFQIHIIYKDKDGVWKPYAEYEWLIKDGYADYRSYTGQYQKPTLQWTEKGRKWILENCDGWSQKAS
jgi:Rha family phage regulatory protein